MVSVPRVLELRNLVWGLLGKSGVWVTLVSRPDYVWSLGRGGLSPDSLTQPSVLSLESTLPSHSKAIEKDQWALISLGEFRSRDTLSIPERNPGAHLLRSAVSSCVGATLGSGLDPGWQHHLEAQQ